MDKIKDILVNKGISPSYHRMKILEYLVKNNNHPTADSIYRVLAPQIPTLSKTTIYNTLKTFVSKGIISSFAGLNQELHYDYKFEPHVHFFCRKCQRIFDLAEPFDCFKDKSIEGHLVLSHQINLEGICHNCLQDEGE
ncbi:MAG: transcriptional repressor [Candidatus Cloacimonetes bacterium]|nr:transcriptional repressor [Candidatus Cloacimonadota bacterium]